MKLKSHLELKLCYVNVLFTPLGIGSALQLPKALQYLLTYLSNLLARALHIPTALESNDTLS